VLGGGGWRCCGECLSIGHVGELGAGMSGCAVMRNESC
jgi:hypothetical protein